MLKCQFFVYFQRSLNFNIGCNRPGMYSNNCDILCPINCKDNTCHIENETCSGCDRDVMRYKYVYVSKKINDMLLFYLPRCY